MPSPAVSLPDEGDALGEGARVVVLPGFRWDPVVLLKWGRDVLAEAVSADEAMRVRAVADTAKTWMRQAKLGLEAENLAAELRVRAERRVGELLRDAAVTGGRAGRGKPPTGGGYRPPTLADLGITANQSSRYQGLADVPQPEFEQSLVEAKHGGRRITSHTPLRYTDATDEWATPQALFDRLNAEFSFTLDVCATTMNAKCARYLTKHEDGLTKPWQGHCWMNPPYHHIQPWIKKAYHAAQQGATVVCLVPVATDTRWWWDYARHGEVRFLPGRLRFNDAPGSAPFPSAIIVLRGREPSTTYWPYQ